MSPLARLLGWHLHQWGKWYERYSVESTVTGATIGMVQQRTCAQCGLKQFKRSRLV